MPYWHTLYVAKCFFDCLAEPVRNDVIEFLLEEMRVVQGWLHTVVFYGGEWIA